ncbi:DNA repair protein RecN [Fictibacillus terranigra]|uniref:DNA repair protein RecN n=1 Tax=Fictibacillus terranigra TaxID=3058424 RepID=A0ABT8E9W5_9BACL|nr:DNA repair protein RecN [Fictibacillus sp. CENA-BCM004]MDN4074690.1 DNA repair protein RecN [Fictibacillus sp. CENA-BCM004]
MLAELSIRNFAIIDALTISFNKGLTVLTGETGAGKSIIIDAIGLLIGGRGSSEFVRYGTNKAEIEGLFLVDSPHPVFAKAEELGIDIQDGMIVLKRDIMESGKSVCRINGKLVTLSLLKEFGQSLVDIHGQHETQYLMQPEMHLSLLDSFGGDEMEHLISKYQDVYYDYKEMRKQLRNLTENEQQMNQRVDLIQYQLEEISNAELLPNEDEELQEEKLRLGNYEKLFNSLQDSYQSLYGEQKGIENISVALSHLQNVAHLDEELHQLEENVANHFYALEEAAFTIRNYFETMEFDPARLDFIETRLNEISKLKRKYGNSVNEILEYACKIEKELDVLQNKDGNIEALRQQLQNQEKLLQKHAQKLGKKRKNLAERLTNEILQELKELYMEKTVFDIVINSLQQEGGQIREQDFGKYGSDEVEFFISTNPGEPLKPLAKVASGGELSRVILALKSIFSHHQGITAIIFDEVDTGVSGRVAQAIAEKIFRVSEGSQVLCITHLPQVAAMADTHLHISKETSNKRTTTHVVSLETTQKVNEIGRMISGVEITELTKQHARELLDLAEEIKKTS